MIIYYAFLILFDIVILGDTWYKKEQGQMRYLTVHVQPTIFTNASYISFTVIKYYRLLSEKYTYFNSMIIYCTFFHCV